MSSLKIQAGLALAIVAVASFSPAAQAAPIARQIVGTAAGLCTPAFGPSEVAIRKRPLSVQNEGSTNAFITCSFSSQGQPTAAGVYVNSIDGAVHTVTCTGVTSYLTATNQYSVKSVDVGPGTGQEEIAWVPADFTGTTTNFPSSYFSVSCGLPPGTGVNDIYVSFSEEIGT